MRSAQFKRDDARVGSLEAVVATDEDACARTTRSALRKPSARGSEGSAGAKRMAPCRSARSRRPRRALVHDTYFVVGDWVPAGGAVASVLPPGNVKVRFYVPEPLLGAPQAGSVGDGRVRRLRRAVRVRRIAFIADRASSRPPVLYSKENRAKLVYLDRSEAGARRCRQSCIPGQPVDVTLPAS